MRSFFTLIITCLMVTFASQGAAKIIETVDITDLLKLVDRDTLLVLDIDNTLLVSTQCVGMTKWGWSQTSRFEKAGMSHMEAMKAAHDLLHDVWAVSEMTPVDERLPLLIKRFQDQGVVVLGLSNRPPRVDFVTADQLQSIGISLSRTALNKDDFKVESEVDTHYTEGVIFVGEMGDKGKALEAFLRTVLHAPKKVVFVDDHLSNIRTVESMKIGAEYTGVWYRKAEKLVASYNQEIADLQFQYKDKILSDEDAKKLIKAGFAR